MPKYRLIQEKCGYENGKATVVVEIDGQEHMGKADGENNSDTKRRALREATGLSKIRVVSEGTVPKIWAKVSVNGSEGFTGRGETIEAAYVDALNQEANSDIVVAVHTV